MLVDRCLASLGPAGSNGLKLPSSTTAFPGMAEPDASP